MKKTLGNPAGRKYFNAKKEFKFLENQEEIPYKRLL